MSYAKISQVNARRYRKERDEARATLASFVRRGAVSNWPGTDLGGVGPLNDITMADVRTARQLGYAVFAVPDAQKSFLRFYALKP